MKVTDNGGLSAIASVSVAVEEENKPPIGSLYCDPTEGPAPLTVTFTARYFYDEDGYVAKIEWDFENDGVFDAETIPDEPEETAVHTYEAEGI